MADITALKNRIRAAIKANDNQEITGPILQQTLLDMVDELDETGEIITTNRIADNAVTSGKIADNAVTSGKITDNAVTSDKIADNAVTSGKITDNAVTSDKIADNAVTSGKITDNAVTSDKIVDNAVTSGKITDNAVTSDKIADNAVTSGKITDNAVTSDKIADNAVTSGKITDNAVTSDKIGYFDVDLESVPDFPLWDISYALSQQEVLNLLGFGISELRQQIRLKKFARVISDDGEIKMLSPVVMEGDIDGDFDVYFMAFTNEEHFYKIQLSVEGNTITGAMFLCSEIPLFEIQYGYLKQLRDNHKLIPGAYYRITDYVTTTAAEYTQSAGHVFDVVVLALDDSTLDCKAMAIRHEGDTYFNNADLSKWELKYDIDNDTTKYTWADATNGKGVIYWMRDEWGNEFDYDFKNIMFKKYKIKSSNDIHLSTNASPLATKIYNQIVADLSATYTDVNEVSAMWYIPHSGTALYVSSSDFSSFSYTDWTPDANAKYIEIMFASTQKGYIVAEVVDAGFFYTFDNYNTTSSAHEDYSLGGNVTNIVIGNKTKKSLPFINFIGRNITRSFSGVAIKKCRYSVFGYYLNRIYIDEAQWICGIGINGMRGSYFTRVIIGTIVRVNNTPQYTNSIYVSYLTNTYIEGNNNYLTGGLIQYGYFGYNCYYNDIRSGTYILLDKNCSQNTFGENCESIKLGNECCRNVFGNRARYITGGDKIQNSIFGPDCNNIIIGQDANNLQDYAQAIEVDATTCYVNIYSTTATSSTTYLSRIVVKNSASGTSTTPKDIVTTAGNSYITTFHGVNDIDLVV